jgi:hypothetical protein
MSDQGFPPTPPSGGTPPLPKDTSSSQKLAIEITKITKELRDQPPPEGKIRGDVINRNQAEHKVTVRTSKGDVEVRLPPERPLPAKGSEVEIRIPPRPPTENVKQQPATLRVTAPPPQAPPPSTPSAPPPQTSVSIRPPSYTPPSYSGGTPPAATIPPTVIPGQNVQLTLLPPAQLAQIRIPPPALITQSQPVSPAFQPPPPAVPASIAPTVPQPVATTPLPPLQSSLPALADLSIQNTSMNTPSLLPVHTPSSNQNLITQLLKLPSPLFTPPPPLPATGAMPLPQTLPPVIQPNILSADTLFQGTKPPDIQNTLNTFITPPPVKAGQAVPTPPVQAPSLGVLPQSPAPVMPFPSGTPIQTQITHSLPPPIILAEPGQIPSPAHFTPPPTAALHNMLFQATQLPATVIGLTAQDQPVIALQSNAFPTPLHFILQNTQAEVGTSLSIPVSLIRNGMEAMGLPLPSTAMELLSQSQWPALHELTQLLMNTSPQIAQNFMQMMPSPQNPAQLGSAFMFFIAALRTGDVSSWLGERPLEILKRLGKGELLTRLGRDFGSLSRAMGEPLPHDWRGLSFPFANQNELQNLVVYYKKEEHEDTNKNKSTQTRFIFDLDLNRLGPVQLDGLYKPGRLDMVVRTDPTLSEDMKQMMRHYFATALRASELSGELSFQHDTENFIKIIDSREKVGLFT